MTNLVLIGCGNMGSAIADAVIENKLFTADSMTIVEKYRNDYTAKLSNAGSTILDSIDQLNGNLELVIIAVKPQDAANVLQSLSPKTNKDSLIISIMAGITLNVMESALSQAQIIRCIPNTPCAIHKGMTVYCGNEKVSDQSLKTAQSILSCMGKAFAVEKEVMIDAATAISGSGPAYVFYLAEAMKAGAVKLGFSEEQADMLSRQTLLGASSLLDQSKDTPEELRRKVTSPKGTTEAATRSFDQDELKSRLIKGFQAAFDRSLELGK